jgi:hypothetical protein
MYTLPTKERIFAGRGSSIGYAARSVPDKLPDGFLRPVKEPQVVLVLVTTSAIIIKQYLTEMHERFTAAGAR